MNQIIKYAKCSCGEINFIPEQSKHLKCYFCGKWEEKPQTEENTKQKVREMVKTLLPTETPNINFPDSNLCDGDICPGWFTNSINTITIPRKTLYLPHDEIADTTAHESAHKPTWEDKQHGTIWENKYHEFRNQLFGQYSTWINNPNPNAQFTKGYKDFKIVNSYWQAEYGIKKSDYVFEPYKEEDDDK